MTAYPFELVCYGRPGPLQDNQPLRRRPFGAASNTFEADAERFVPGQRLEDAINTAIAVGEPLLITGEAGTGKTQAAYYAAYKLGVGPVLHFQVKSDSTAHDLLYHFDTVRYFHDAHQPKAGAPLDKWDYVEPRPLWEAMTWGDPRQLRHTAARRDTGEELPRVLLIDEIDKAPRDFPNDLLHELDKLEFHVVETQDRIRVPPQQRPIVFITSNSERRLPEPFLRRCVYHHIRFNEDLVRQAMQNRRQDYENLGDDFLELALKRFLALRERNLRKRPATAEFLVWLRVLALTAGRPPARLEEDLVKLPYLGVLLKDHQDMEELGTR